MEAIGVVALLAVLEFQVFGILVGRARGRYEVKAPATSGHETFERYFRVHQNTLEQLVIFIPSLVAFGFWISAPWGAGIGVVFLVGRVLYLRGYVADPAKRSAGFLVTFVSSSVLLLGGLWGAITACA